MPYWIIQYQIIFQSDFHVGAGITLMGANLHGLRMGDDNFPYMPATEVRGLLRLGGQKLKLWKPELVALFDRNFGPPGKTKGKWSYTPARYPHVAASAGVQNAEDAGLVSKQSHIRQKNGIADKLFGYQKGGASVDFGEWRGKIYSVEQASEQDVAFFVACMRTQDRIGHRRSRGYGKVVWQPVSIQSYGTGEPPKDVAKMLQEWLQLVCCSLGKEKRDEGEGY